MPDAYDPRLKCRGHGRGRDDFCEAVDVD